MTSLLPDPDVLGGDPEPLDEGGTWLLDLVAAVDHLRRGHRPDLTVWDAIAEALRWSHPDLADSGHPSQDHPDPLGATLREVLSITPLGLSPTVLQRAIRVWVLTMGAQYNACHHWPHPQPRRRFPPPLQALGLDPDLPPQAA